MKSFHAVGIEPRCTTWKALSKVVFIRQPHMMHSSGPGRIGPNSTILNRAGVTMKRLDAFAKQHRTRFRQARYGALVAAALASPATVQAGELVTICTKLDICYCVNSDYRDAITTNVTRVRKLITDNKSQGKTIGYSQHIPLSPAGGGSFAVNSEISAKVAENVTARFGARSMFCSTPALKRATRWVARAAPTSCICGRKFWRGTRASARISISSISPARPISKYFALTGQGDLERLEACSTPARRRIRPSKGDRPGHDHQGGLPQLLRVARVRSLQLRFA